MGIEDPTYRDTQRMDSECNVGWCNCKAALPTLNGFCVFWGFSRLASTGGEFVMRVPCAPFAPCPALHSCASQLLSQTELLNHHIAKFKSKPFHTPTNLKASRFLPYLVDLASVLGYVAGLGSWHIL